MKRDPLARKMVPRIKLYDGAFHMLTHEPCKDEALIERLARPYSRDRRGPEALPNSVIWNAICLLPMILKLLLQQHLLRNAGTW